MHGFVINSIVEYDIMALKFAHAASTALQTARRCITYIHFLFRLRSCCSTRDVHWITKCRMDSKAKGKTISRLFRGKSKVAVETLVLGNVIHMLPFDFSHDFMGKKKKKKKKVHSK